MDHYGRTNSRFTDNEEQMEQLYCSLAVQSPDDIIWEGSDTEQTVEEIQKKRFRYEAHARRYLCGHRTVLQSASLRGPFNQETGWVNPWRYRPLQEPEWRQSGSEHVLCVREDVMNRALDHGLGYLDPSEALAWCKAAAEAERQTRIETEPCDSLEAVNSEDESYGEDNAIKDTKRPADAQWLKASFFSKRARYDTPISSPTPIPDLPAEPGRRRRRGSARLAAGSGEGQVDLISHATTRGSYDPYRWETISRGSRSTAMETGWKDSRGNPQKRMPGLDEPMDSQEAAFVAIARVPPRIQAKGKRIYLANKSPSNLKPSGLGTLHTLTKASANSQAPNLPNHSTQESGTRSNKSPRLPRNAGTHDDLDSVEDDSFITEIMPSSKNLEKFQFRKKRKKAKNHDPGHHDRGSHDQSENAFMSSSMGMSSEVDEKSSYPSASAAADVVNSLSVYQPSSEAKESHPSHTNSIEIESLDIDPAQALIELTKSEQSNHSSDLMEDFEFSPSEMRGDRPFDLVGAARHVLPEIRDPFTKSATPGTELSPMRINEHSQPWAKYSKSVPPADQYLAANSPKLDSRVLLVTDGEGAQGSVVSEYIHQSQPLPGLIRKSMKMPMLVQHVEDPNENRIPDKNSTQSASPTTVEPPRSLCSRDLSPEEAVDSPLNVKITIAMEDGELTDELVQEKTTSFEGNAHVLRSDILFVRISNHLESDGSSDDDVQEEMGITQNALSQDSRHASSKNSSESNQNRPSQQLLNANDTELGRTTTISAEGGENQTPQKEEQETWQGCRPQSPWMEENLQHLAGIIATKYHDEQAPVDGSESGMFAIGGISPMQGGAEEDLDSQHLERPKTPENDGIKPFKDFMTPTPSPEPMGLYTNRDDFSDSQLLVEATIKNPRTRIFENPASGKQKKRVSFGVLPSEGIQNSEPECSTLWKSILGSPPPPQAVERFCDDDVFDNGNSGFNKFRKHFSAAARFRRLLPKENSSLVMSSPAIGAMAEAFIAADRETSTDHERSKTIHHTPSRYLEPKSDARTNVLSQDRVGDLYRINSDSKLIAESTRTIEYDLGVDLDDFLFDGGGVLEDWSVEAEVKKANKSRGGTAGRSNSEKSRSLFGVTRGCS